MLNARRYVSIVVVLVTFLSLFSIVSPAHADGTPPPPPIIVTKVVKEKKVL